MGKIIERVRERQRATRQRQRDEMAALARIRQGEEMIEDIDRRIAALQRKPRPWWRFW